ncbi:RNA polymerase sigma factor [Nonomuraea sp. CA-143628]|uniref:RNA polymerase sigma factor n=1 Tax=Nonomuraea sp. CA-143628 TaxID=3239997 RepID=UPI003D92672A
MAESAETPMGFEMAKRGFLRRVGGAKSGKVKGVEEILEDLERQSSTYKNIILTRIDKRYVDDVWGEARVKMAAHLRAGNVVDNPAAYMTRVCINCANDELNKIKKRAEKLLGDDFSVLQLDPLQDDESSLGYRAVKDILDDVLAERDHTAYVLRHVFHLNGKEIARAMGWSHVSVRQALCRAQKILDDPEVQRRFDYRPRSSEK